MSYLVIVSFCCYSHCYSSSLRLLRDRTVNDNNTSSSISEAKAAGEILKGVTLHTLTHLIHTHTQQTNNHTMSLLITTQTIIASQRHTILTQEIGAAAASDILTMRFEPVPLTKDQRVLIANETARQLSLRTTTNTIARRMNLKVRLTALNPNNQNLRAEQSCTQLVYHYLLPI